LRENETFHFAEFVITLASQNASTEVQKRTTKKLN
jgi:hypothetical protein